MQVLRARVTKGQQSLLLNLASYPLIEIKKHILDTMKAKQVPLEKERIFFPKYQQE